MKKMLLMSAVVVATFCAIADTWTDPSTGITWTYVVNGNEASVGTGNWSSPAVSSSTTGAISIPSSLGGRPVTSIGNCAFYYCTRLTSVTIPSSVMSIGNNAFYGCESLTSMTIPSSVTSIGGGAFEGCSGLTSVTIPSSVKSIGSCAFERCSGLTTMTIPSSVTSIGGRAFSYCTSLSAIDVAAENVAYTSQSGVLFNKGMTELIQCPGGKQGSYVIPSSVANIGYYAFNSCSGLTSVTIPPSVTSIGESAFGGCSGLTSVTIPPSVTSIGESAFGGCSGLTSVKMSSGLITIGTWTFAGCSGLTSVTIPASVTSIGGGTFAQCSSLSCVVFEGDAPNTGSKVFQDTPSDMVVRVKGGSGGWVQWNDRKVYYDGGMDVRMTVTNIVVHYIQTSELSPMAAPITPDVGIVNVMTEIEGGIVAVPESWATNYPSFKQKFGDDFAVALTRETGKFDANRKPMYVWQDYVAGTDPTNVEDQFRASVTMVEGKPVISYTPVLSETEAAKRVYTIYGKVKLQDEEWTAIPEGQEADYNFFKVTVKMK